MANAKFYNLMDGKHPMTKKQNALYNFILPMLEKNQQILLVSKDDGKDETILNVINGDSYLRLNQNGLAVCDIDYDDNGLFEYYVVCFYDTSKIGSKEKTTWDISRHSEQGKDFDRLGYVDLIVIDDYGNLIKSSQTTSLFESKKSVRNSMKESSDYTVYAVFPTKNGYIVNTDIKGYQYIQIVGDKITKHSAWREDWFANAKKRAGFKDFDEDDMEEKLLRRYEKDVRCIIDHSDLGLNESKKSVRRSMKESKFSLFDINQHDPFVKDWLKKLKKDFSEISVDSMGDDEIVFRVFFEKDLYDLDIFDEVATSCMPNRLIEYLDEYKMNFGYRFVYEDDRFTEDDFVFIKFVVW